MGNKKSTPAGPLSEKQIRMLEVNTGKSRYEIEEWYRQFLVKKYFI